MKLFDRSVEVSFQGADIVPVTKLRVAFEVAKHDGTKFNAATIQIYNLNASSRGALARLIYNKGDPHAHPVIKCILRAGYDDELVQLIEGEILYATNQRVGPDWITDIKLYTGLSNAKKAYANFSYGSKTSAKKISNDMLVTMQGVDVQYTQDAEDALNNENILSFTVAGNAYKASKQFLEKYNLSFQIEDGGVLLVYVNDKPREPQRSQTEANTFRPENGLLGTPKITNSGVQIRSLLRPNLKIYQRIYVESQSIDSTLQNQNQFTNEYYITKIKHIGDTHSDEWYTEIIAAYVGIDKELLV